MSDAYVRNLELLDKLCSKPGYENNPAYKDALEKQIASAIALDEYLVELATKRDIEARDKKFNEKYGISYNIRSTPEGKKVGILKK